MNRKNNLSKVFLAGCKVFLLCLLAGASPAWAATFTVDRSDDAAGATVCSDAAPNDCSLRGAIILANTLPGSDTIILPAGTYTLTITGTLGENAANTGDLDLTGDLAITGAGASSTIIDSNGSDRVFHLLPSAANVWISGVTIQNGSAGTGGGIFSDVGNGGGIFNQGDLGSTLTLADSIVRDNTAERGGGIFNDYPATTIITRSTISGNTATGTVGDGSGGGIFNLGPETLIITESTIRGNLTDGHGGGIHNKNGGVATITNSTISGNTADTGGGIANDTGSSLSLANVTIANNSALLAGGIYASSTVVEVGNTIIGGNTATDDPDCRGTLTSQGHNLVQDVSPGCTVTGDLTGNLTGVDPLLGPLADNGGPTETHALLSGSPAIDAGDNVGCLATDQRGVGRPVGAVCDIGAFEFIQPVAAFATSEGQFTNLSAVPEAILPTTGKPAGVTFPFGFFSWTVSGLVPTQIITVTMTFPASIPAGAQYWKVINGTWTDVTLLLGDNDGDSVLTLTIADGGLGDADGLPNGQISDPGGVGLPTAADADGDGIGDPDDNCPVDPNPDQLDTDSDGQGNACDPDDDNDGVADTSDAFPLDASESVDTDGDGIGNNADSDDDNDGVEDTSDAFPLDASESVDTDGDGIGNNADSDDDGDGVPDAADNCRLTANPDQRDTDRDGVGDACDPQIGPPRDKDQCKDGGWALFNNPSFRNQGQCVSSVTSQRR